MTNPKTCFISFTVKNEEFVKYYLIPLLKELNYNYNYSSSNLTSQTSLYEFITKTIKNSELVICVYDKNSPYISFEIGVALGNNRPIITILPLETYLDFPDEFKYTNFLIYDKSNFGQFRRNFISKVKSLSEEIIDKPLYLSSYKPEYKLIAIQVGNDESDYEQELRFTYEFIELVKKITENPQIFLSEVSKGSLKSILNIDLKSYADLLEKIIFFIPELKKKKLENLKIEMDIERTRTETEILKLEKMNKFADIMEKYQKLNINIQIDSQLIISQNSQGVITIKEPKLLLNS